MTATVLEFPRPPKRSIEVSPADMEAIAFDNPGSVIELPVGSGWARLEVDGVRYHAWRNEVSR